MYNSGRGSSSQSDYYNRYQNSSRRDEDDKNGDDKTNSRKAPRRNRWDNPEKGGDNYEYKRLPRERSRSPVNMKANTDSSYHEQRDNYNAEGLNLQKNYKKPSNNWSDSSSDDEGGKRDYCRKGRDDYKSSHSRSGEKNNNNGNGTGLYNPMKMLNPDSTSGGLSGIYNPIIKPEGLGLKGAGNGHKLDVINSEVATTPPQVKTANSSGIQIKLLPQLKPLPTSSPMLLKSKSLKVASVFNIDDDDEEEEMPAECKMRMKNVGRETPTSAGPNSFGKTKIGFCNVNQIKERKLQEELLKKTNQKK